MKCAGNRLVIVILQNSSIGAVKCKLRKPILQSLPIRYK